MVATPRTNSTPDGCWECHPVPSGPINRKRRGRPQIGYLLRQAARQGLNQTPYQRWRIIRREKARAKALLWQTTRNK